MVGRSKKLPINPELAALRAAVTEGLPPATERTEEVGAQAVAGGKVNKGRWLGAGEARVFVPNGEIVEEIRALLADSWTPGDIQREMARKFGGNGASFAKHIAHARQRNLATLARKPEEAKSDSVQQWQQLLTEERQKRAQASADVEVAKVKLETAYAAYDDATPADYKIARDRLDVAVSALERAEKLLAAAKHSMAQYQHTIDQILGNLSPIEYKDANEKKSELANPTEPLTEKESNAKLQQLLGKIRGEIPAEVSTPSAN